MAEPIAAYHADHSRLTRTALKCFMESRSEYKLRYVDGTLPPLPPRRCQVEGIVLHAIIIEQKSPMDFLVPYPNECLKSNGDLKGPDALAFREQHHGKMCVKFAELRRLTDLLNAVLRNPLVVEDSMSRSAIRETEVNRTVNGVECKCRPDLRYPGLLIDYKFMQNIDPLSFQRSAKSFKYWLQYAHYTAVTHDGDFVFRCIETKPPFRVHDYRYDLASRQLAFDTHEKLLADLKSCRDTGDWSDVWPSEIEIKPWELGESDEIVEVGEAYET